MSDGAPRSLPCYGGPFDGAIATFTDPGPLAGDQRVTVVVRGRDVPEWLRRESYLSPAGNPKLRAWYKLATDPKSGRQRLVYLAPV